MLEQWTFVNSTNIYIEPAVSSMLQLELMSACRNTMNERI